MSKVYAVKKGRIPGLYYNWDECFQQIHGFEGCDYKSFFSVHDAEKYLNEEERVLNEDSELPYDSYAFIDGSYNKATETYGYGGFLIDADGNKHIIQGNGNNNVLKSMRNVAGEILGAMAAVEKALELGMKKIDLYYDYAGIEAWPTEKWKRNKPATIAYAEFMKNAAQNIEIGFIKVKSHTGIDENEEADLLAKKAVGL